MRLPLNKRRLNGQRHVGANVQAVCVAMPAILSVKSVLSAVKNTIAVLPRRTGMNYRGHKTVVHGLKELMLSLCRTMRDNKLNLELGAAQLGNEQQAYMLSEKSRYSSGGTN